MCENGKKKKNTTFDIYAYINNIFNGLILKTNQNQEKYANTTAFYS